MNGVDLNQTYTYQSSNYTDAETGTTGQLTSFQVPTLAILYPTLFQQSDFYDQLLASYHGSVEITIQTNPTTNPIPDKLITYQNYEMGLIYFSDRQLVTYNVTTPNDYWSYDLNGSLKYVTNTTTVTESYYKPVAGTWVDNYTFVPAEPVTRGLWVWNLSAMAHPDAYKIQVTLPGNITNEQTFTTERVQGDTITYQALLPIQATNGVYNANVSIEQLSEVAKQQNGTQTDQNILAGLWNKTAVYNNETYYFANGINMTLDQNGEPTGGVVVNQTTLEQMAQVPTYNFTTSYVPITTQYTLTVTIPDMVMIKYNPLDYPGEMLVARDTNTNQSYGVNTFAGQNMGLTEQVGQLAKYAYLYPTGLVSNPNDYLDSNYIFLVKENGTDGFQSNVLSDVISQNDVATNKTVNLRLSSYITVNNPEATIYQEYSPLVNYNYANDTFTQILATVNQFNTFFTKTVKAAVLQNISNDLMSWAFQWFNSSSGYFRNDVKETASVLELYEFMVQNNISLAPQNKFYFYDVITALNSTINQYIYSDIENTTTETNVVVTRLSYAADSSEPTAFGRELNVLNILKDLYAIYTPMQSSIVSALETKFGTTNDTQTIKNYIQQNYGQMHPMGKALLQSVAIINYNQTVNITSTAMQTEISSLAQQNAQRQILLENLQNDPALQYELYQSGTNFASIENQALLYQQYGLNPALAIQASKNNAPLDQIYTLRDGLLQLLKIINTQQKQSTTIPTPNIFGIFEDKNVLFKLNVGNNHLTVTVQEFLTRMALLVFLIPLFYGLAFEDLKHAMLIFGIYAMVFMVLEVGAQSIQNKIDPSTIAQEVYSGDLFNTAMQDINNLINGHYLDNYFSKPLQPTISSTITYGSTLFTFTIETSQYRTLKLGYANYASSLDQA